jgi:hypothetical protein
MNARLDDPLKSLQAGFLTGMEIQTVHQSVIQDTFTFNDPMVSNSLVSLETALFVEGCFT